MNDNFNTCGEEKYYSDKLWSKDHVFPKVFIYDWKFWQVYLYNFKIIQQTYFLVHITNLLLCFFVFYKMTNFVM